MLAKGYRFACFATEEDTDPVYFRHCGPLVGCEHTVARFMSDNPGAIFVPLY